MVIEGHITYKGTFKVELDMDKDTFNQLPESEQKLLIENTVDADTVEYYDTEIGNNLDY